MKFLKRTNSVILISSKANLYPTHRLGPSMKVIMFGQTPGPLDGIGNSSFLSIPVGEGSQRLGSKRCAFGP